jgi:argininosuccinate lyase
MRAKIMAENLWSARFSKNVNETVARLNSSFPFDKRMWREDIRGSLAHAKMLNRCEIISDSDYKAIFRGLNEIAADIESGALPLDSDAEDIHMFIESVLTERIGDAGKRLHTARSRNDQVATDFRLCLFTEAKKLNELLCSLIETLCTIAEQNTLTIMPGYTHLQRAQPISFGFHMMAYAFMFLRDAERLWDWRKRANVSPLGSSALAGTTYPVDRQFSASELGFERPCENAEDGVSDRDFVAEFMFVLSMNMVHLSRFAEEIILWCSAEFRFVELDDAFATGSSIMPQKKNPDVAELTRGKAGRVFGSLITILTALKGLSLAYNKDLQEDKEAVFGSVDTVLAVLTSFIPMISTMTINAPRMRKAAANGFINATDCADYLVGKGVPFRDAYGIVGRIVAHCEARDLTLETLSLADYKAFFEGFDDDVYPAVDLTGCVNRRRSYGATAPECVDVQVSEAREQLEKHRSRKF